MDSFLFDYFDHFWFFLSIVVRLNILVPIQNDVKTRVWCVSHIASFGHTEHLRWCHIHIYMWSTIKQRSENVNPIEKYLGILPNYLFRAHTDDDVCSRLFHLFISRKAFFSALLYAFLICCRTQFFFFILFFVLTRCAMRISQMPKLVNARERALIKNACAWARF